MKRWIAFCLVLVLLWGCAPGSGGDSTTAVSPIPAESKVETLSPMRDLAGQIRYITHAAGEIDGKAGSNSLEALESAYENGCLYIELDFNFTSDGNLACIHDWYSQYSSGITDNVPLTAEEFRNIRIYDAYTPLLLDDVAAFLTKHEDVYIITDIKDDNIGGLSYIASEYPGLLGRFIPQIYEEAEYDAVYNLGFLHIIYTLYRLDWAGKTDTAHLKSFAKTHPLFAYTFAAQLCDVEGYVEGMLSCGVPLYVHTVNGEEEQNRYFALGITGIYTDEQKS